MGSKLSGRRKISENRSIKELGDLAIGTINSIMKDETAPMAVRLDAAKYLANRKYGTPKQEIGVQGEMKVYRTVEE